MWSDGYRAPDATRSYDPVPSIPRGRWSPHLNYVNKQIGGPQFDRVLAVIRANPGITMRQAMALGAGTLYTRVQAIVARLEERGQVRRCGTVRNGRGMSVLWEVVP